MSTSPKPVGNLLKKSIPRKNSEDLNKYLNYRKKANHFNSNTSKLITNLNRLNFVKNQEQSFKSNSAVAESTTKNGSNSNLNSSTQQKDKLPENMTSQVIPLLFIEVIKLRSPKITFQISLFTKYRIILTNLQLFVLSNLILSKI